LRELVLDLPGLLLDEFFDALEGCLPHPLAVAFLAALSAFGSGGRFWLGVLFLSVADLFFLEAPPGPLGLFMDSGGA
jgi:hypothetical protein